MNYFPFTIIRKKSLQLNAFTLLETLASIAIVSTVILGPLTVAINSSTYSRQTKDVMISTYLIEEAIDLLHHHYDSLYIRCQKGVAPCEGPPDPTKTIGQNAWTLFKDRLGESGGSTSCYKNFNSKGCTFDFLDLSNDAASPAFSSASDSSDCLYLSLTKSADKRDYVCSVNREAGTEREHNLGIMGPKLYTRTVVVESFINPDGFEDLRVTASVTFARSNGTKRTMSVVDFFHPRP